MTIETNIRIGYLDSTIRQTDWNSKFLHVIKCSLTKFVLIDFSLSVKALTLLFISGRGSAISSAKQGITGYIYNLVKN